MPDTAGTVLILGASGLFGGHAARAFEAAGWTVRRYQRGSDMAVAARGAEVIVNGMNPPRYHDWARQIPAITAQVIAAAKASGATVVIPGNVYVYGTQPAPWGPDTPQRPVSRKGHIRVEMEAAYAKAAAEGVQVILLRGGDFLAPGDPRTMFDIVILKQLARGRITAMGNPKAEHAYAFLPDMARVAEMLASIRAQLPRFNDIPYAGLTFSIDDLRREIERQTGRRLTVKQFDWWVMRLASPVWELARELGEMRYLSDHPHRLTAEPLERLLPDFVSTSLADVVTAHLVALRQIEVHPDQTVSGGGLDGRGSSVG